MPRTRSSVISATKERIFSGGRLRAAAIRGIWNAAAAGVMSGSSPLAEVVTRSTGTAAVPFAFFRASAPAVTRSTSAFEVGPRFEPAELVALYGAAIVLV